VDQLAILAQRVEDAIRSRGAGEVPSHEVGLAILGPLRELDEVAYLRFASVYRGFESLADFEAEIATLRSERDRAWRRDDADEPGNTSNTGEPGGPDVPRLAAEDAEDAEDAGKAEDPVTSGSASTSA
jgi:transcriptional repressor NrdR